MTITPLWIATGDVRDSVEFTVFTDAASGSRIVESATKAHTGARSLRVGGISGTHIWGRNHPETTHVRLGYFLNNNGYIGTGSNEHALFGRFRNASDTQTIFGITRQASTNNVIPVINGTNQAAINTLAGLGLTETDTWQHIGLVCRVGDPGYAAFFVNQIAVWEYTGEITGSVGRTTFSQVNTNCFANFAYYDDMYVDDITGEPDSAPPAYRFPVRRANAAGADAEWDSTEAENYEAVDESPHDGDGSYNFSEQNDDVDTFAASSMGTFEGYSIVARHPYVIARRTGSQGTIKLHTLAGSTYKASDPQALGNDYQIVMVTQDTMPDGSAFSTEAALDATQIGYESAGFS